MKPYYQHAGITIHHGDCREVLPSIAPVDCIVTDEPYGQTSLLWDVPVAGWLELAALQPHASVWRFGSLRSFLALDLSGWKLAQDIVWEKHNGSGFASDRFKRVHEQAAQFYRGSWESVYKSPVRVDYSGPVKTVRSRGQTPHTGAIGNTGYSDDGKRIQRSVFRARSCQGFAENETQKPVGILAPLIEYSCAPGGTVLDPFAGSGSTGVAAKMLGREAVIIEVREQQCEVAARRLAQEVLPFGMV